MKNKTIALSLLVGITGLSGCASVVSGTGQYVNLKTKPAHDADCTLTNNKGQWEVTSPGQVYVHKSYHDLKVVCRKKGYKTARMSVASNTGVSVFGNALLGGPLGAGIDVANGAAYSYPTNIIVHMKKKFG